MLEENSRFGKKIDPMTMIGLMLVGAVSVMGATLLYSSDVSSKPPLVDITGLINAEVLPAGPLEVRGTSAVESGVIRAISVRVDGGSPVSVTPISPNDFSEWSVLLDVSSVGGHTIEVEAVDGSGKTSSTMISVIVTDEVMKMPIGQIIEATGPSGAFVNYPLPTVQEKIRIFDDPDCLPSPGSMFPIGKTTVTCTASLARGNKVTADFTISVRDSTPPTIIAPADVTVKSSGEEFTQILLGDPIVADIVDANAVVSNNAPADGFSLGTSIVVWTASDHYDNKAIATQKVTVTGTSIRGGGGGGGSGGSASGTPRDSPPTDTTPPTVKASPNGGTFTSSQSVILSANEPATIYYTRDGSTPTTSSAVFSSAISIVSTTTLKYFATDAAGNSGSIVTQVYTINTIDTTAPTVAITQPAANSVVSATGGKILVTGTAGRDIEIVEVRVDDGSYATATSKASGDWSSWRITLPITAGEHRLVPRATDNAGNQAWNSIYVTIQDPPSDGGVGDSDTVDNFGIEKIYPTASGGNEWYVNMNDPDNDSLFRNLPSMTKQPDGSWQVSGGERGQVRMEAWSPENEKWQNVEITAYVKMVEGSNELIQLYSRGGHHTSSNECLGSAYKARLYGDGEAAWVKEVTHPAYAGNRGTMQATDESLNDRWIGFKAVIYNFVENGKTYVRLESYIDNDVTDADGNLVIKNNWQLASAVEDKGGWSTTNSDFNATCAPMNKDSTEQYRQRDEILSLPGGTSTQSIAAFRSDDLTWNWKHLSVREIQAP